MNWDELASRTDIRRVELARIQFSEKLSKLDIDSSFTWSNDSTYTNLKKINRTFTDPDGNIADIIRLRVSGVEYTLKDNIPQVDAFPGSFFHDDSASELYVRPQITTFDSVFTHHNASWTDVTSAIGSIGGVALTNAHNDEIYTGMEYSRFYIVEIDFTTIPVGGVHLVEYSKGGGLWGTATLTPVTGNNNWTGSSTYYAVLTIPTDWARDNSVGDDETGTPYRFWLRWTATTGYSTQGVAGFANTVVVLDEQITSASYFYSVGNTEKYFDGVEYAARIPQSSSNSFASVIQANTGDSGIPTFGADQSTGAGTLSIGNGDGALDAFIKTTEIRGGFVERYVGFDTSESAMAFDDYEKLPMAMVKDCVRTDSGVVFGLQNLVGALNIRAVNQFYSQIVNPRMDVSMVGKPIPIFFGNTATLGPAVFDPDTEAADNFATLLPSVKIKQGRPGKGGGFVSRRYQFGSELINSETGYRHGMTLVGIWKSPPNRSAEFGDIPQHEILSIHYEKINNGTAIKFKGDFEVSDGDDVRADAQGILDDNLGTFSGSPLNPISEVPHVIHAMARLCCGIPSSLLDIASLAYVGETKNGISGTLVVDSSIKDNACVYLRGDENAMDVITSLAFSINCVFQQDNDGIFRLSSLVSDVSDDTLVLHEEDLNGFTDSLTLDYVVSDFYLGYKQIPSTNIFTQNKALEFTQTDDGTWISDKPTDAFGWPQRDVAVNTYMVTPAKADARAKQVYDWLKRGTIQIDATVILGAALKVLLGETTLWTRQRMIGGNVFERQTLLIQASKDPTTGLVITKVIEAP